jgi:hypothetical protein
MTTRDFTLLPPDEKTNYLWDNGICIGQRLVDYAYIVSIFDLGSFFVEVRYSRSNTGIDAIRVMEEVPAWEAYVDRTICRLFHLS